MQHEITPTLSLQVGYVANKGTHVFAGDTPSYDANQPSIAGFGTLTTDQRRPFFKKFGWTQQIFCLGNDAADTYNALQAAVEKRFSKGYQFLAHYTWSKALTYDSDYYAINPKLNHGLSNSDRKHVFVLTNVIDLPFGQGRHFLASLGGITDRVVGGWSLAATTSRESGLPFHRRIQVVSPTGTPVPVDPTSSEPYTSQEGEMAILRQRAVCHCKPAAHREIPSGRGSDLLLAHLETPRGIRCADRVSSRPISPSLRISH